MAITNGHSREERIKREYNRLKRFLKDLPKDKLSAAEGMLRRIAFMTITLEDMEEDINANGEVEPFSQGGGPTYDRQRPAVNIYNTTIKNYTAACKQLMDLIPGGPPPSKEEDPFMKIMGRKKNV